MNWPATIANSLWISSSLPAWSKFQHATSHPEEVQANLLQRLLADNRASAFGRAHDFSGIKNYEDFARRVPLADYEFFAPWIDRIRAGEMGVLTREKVTHLIPTSGSTGTRKLIPFTARLQKGFDRAIAPWMVDLARRYPKMISGPAYWSITPPQLNLSVESSAVPIGFADDASYLGGIKSRLVRAAMVVPDMSGASNELDDFHFQTLLCLLRQRDLRLISVWHPSFLTLLLDALPKHWEKILGQLHHENKQRACELEHSNLQQPESLWPYLQMISCWGDGHARLALADLRTRFPNTFIQPKGLLATEAVVTIPWGDDQPLAVHSHFFEFIDGRGKTYLAADLQQQEIYEVVVTTAGGLWRYRMHDQVKVTGFVGKTPSLQFMGRRGNVSDLFGEKLSEAFVADAIQTALSGTNSQPRFVMLAPDQDAAGWRYTLYIEGVPLKDLAKIMDQALQQNPNYAHCRHLLQLQPARIFSISARGYETFTSHLVANGKRLGDIKPVSLSRKSGWSKIFPGTFETF